jgi:hypothetical protein
LLRTLPGVFAQGCNGHGFSGVLPKKTTTTVDEIHLSLLSPEDLIEAKRKAGRLQELAGPQQFEKIKKKQKRKRYLL